MEYSVVLLSLLGWLRFGYAQVPYGGDALSQLAPFLPEFGGLYAAQNAPQQLPSPPRQLPQPPPQHANPEISDWQLINALVSLQQQDSSESSANSLFGGTPALQPYGASQGSTVQDGLDFLLKMTPPNQLDTDLLPQFRHQNDLVRPAYPPRRVAARPLTARPGAGRPLAARPLAARPLAVRPNRPGQGFGLRRPLLRRRRLTPQTRLRARGGQRRLVGRGRQYPAEGLGANSFRQPGRRRRVQLPQRKVVYQTMTNQEFEDGEMEEDVISIDGVEQMDLGIDHDTTDFLYD